MSGCEVRAQRRRSASVNGKRLDEADRIGIPAREIQRRGAGEMIEIVREAHEIMGDEPIRRVRADDLDLHPIVGVDLFGREAPEVEPRGGIRLGHGQVRQRDRVEGIDLHRPEHGAPGFVQSLGRLIAPPQPVSERSQVSLAPGQDRVVTAVFIVGLPARDRRVGPEFPREDFDDARALAPVEVGRKAVMAARAEAARPSFAIDRSDFGMAVHQPFRRRRGRRSQHDLQARRAQRIQRAAQPCELQAPRLRLDPAPREFADAHIADAHRAHAPRVVGP